MSSTVHERPVKPAVFHILLALASGDLHGLGIAGEVDEATSGAMRLGPGTLYRSLKEMVEVGLIKDVPAPAEDDDPRRRYYAITEEGGAVLQIEVARFENIVRVAQRKNVLPGTA